MPAPIFLIRKRLQSRRILSRIHHKKPSRNPRRNKLLLFNWGLFARAWPGLNTPSGKLLDISCISATSKEEQVANAGQWPPNPEAAHFRPSCPVNAVLTKHPMKPDPKFSICTQLRFQVDENTRWDNFSWSSKEIILLLGFFYFGRPSSLHQSTSGGHLSN